MNSVTSQQEIVNLHEVCETQKKRIHLLEQENERIKQERDRLKRLIATPNHVMATGEKLAHWVAKPMIAAEKPNGKGLVRVDISKIAEQTGMSSSTAGRYIQKICERFGATHDVEPYTTLKGQNCHLVYVKPDDPVWVVPPDELTLAAEHLRTINGNECPRCHSSTYHVKKRTLTNQDVATCDTCNLVKVFPVVQVNEPLEPGDYFPPEKGPQPGEPFGDQEIDPLAADIEKVPSLESLLGKPQNMQDVYTVGGIPEELKALPQWVPWRYEPKKDKEGNIIPDAKPNKVPYNETKPGRWPQKAKTNDPATWTTYERVCTVYEASQREQWKNPYDGIGFVFKEGGDLVGIDYDHCISQQGEIDGHAQARIAALNSYSEISPSGTGIHQIARGHIPAAAKRSDVEMYDTGRFFTFTGQHLPGTPLTVENRQTEIDALFAEIAPPVRERSTPPAPTVFTSCPGLTDAAVLEKARNARNGAKFRMLYDEGKIEGYPSQSEADLALCVMLAYWSNSDEGMIDRLFRASKLYRDKWERNVGAGISYGEKTIRQAVAA